MELIVKPTSLCNFNCTFCSAGCLKLQHQTKVQDSFKKILATLKPQTIIVTGGEPLMVQPSFYEELLALGNWNISFTSNLKDFYHTPEKWKALLKNDRVSVITSFQYGNARLWDKDTVYDEDMFIKVFRLFEQQIGYKLQFIAVISDENEQYAFKHLRLAKKLGTKCKINGQMPLGKSTSYYPQHKLIKLWLDIYESEYRQQLAMDICFNGGCNLNTRLMCDSTIRAIAFTEDGIICSHCEDDLTNGIYSEVDVVEAFPTKEKLKYNELISAECLFCELHYVCNGCKQYRKINKKTKAHCQHMKELKDRILNTDWRIQPL